MSSSILFNYRVLNYRRKIYRLLQIKYPRSDAIQYYNKLNSIKQNDFVTIKLFQREIHCTCTRLAICNYWNETQKIQKAQETLYNGLSRRTQLEIARLNIRDFSEMYNIINTTEAIIIEQIKASHVRNTHKDKRDKNETRKYPENRKRKSPTSSANITKVIVTTQKIAYLRMKINLKNHKSTILTEIKL